MTGFGSKQRMAVDRDALFEKLEVEQPAQEPVATVQRINGVTFGYLEKAQPIGTQLYTAPPQREWIGLTPEETSGFTQHEMTVVKYVSKVLQEKNG